MRIFNPSTGSGEGSVGATGPQGPQGPGGGGGSGGLMFYLNQATAPDSTTGLPTTSPVVAGFAVKELGRTANSVQSTLTTSNLPTNAFNLVAGFVSDLQDPNITSIPPGLWDLNFWASSTANANNQTVVQVRAYVYNGTALGSPFATSDDLYIYDPTVVTQYTANLVVGAGVTITASDRIYIEIWAKGSSNNYTLTLKFGDGTPTHLHTTIPSVSGTGLVKVVNGLPQTPASLLTNTDVAANANIALSKINLNTLLGSMNMSASVVDTYDRGSAGNTSQNLGLGNFVHMSLFTPLVDIVANFITIISAAQPASGTLRLGLYSFNESTSKFSKLAEASSYTLNGAAAGPIKVGLISACSLSAGNRYAVAVAITTTLTAFSAAALPSGTITAILNLSPIVASTFAAQNILLDDFTHTSANTPNYRIFARVSNT